MNTKISSFMFATAMPGNILAIEYAHNILGTNINWGSWAAAMIIPGITCLLVTSFITYLLIKPDVKVLDNKTIAKQGLAELGALKSSEKALIFIFCLALLGWSSPSVLNALFDIKINIDSAAVALSAMGLSVLLGVIKFEDIVNSKECIGTLFWFGGIISLSSILNKLKFFEWLGVFLNNNLDLSSINPYIGLFLIAVASILVRYFFASATIYLTTLMPVFFLLGNNIGIPPYALAFLLFSTASYGGAITHYGGPAAPVIFGGGYNTVKEWWITGLMCAFLMLIICYGVGVPLWVGF